ncbi:ParB N-terminal domain-containing protein [Streptococcus gallolyticus]|uniref:ParB-like nuclease domain-containing protein n=1 Tax=Streptococcus gallolyticus TaxID=315405 RepID=A0A1H9U394_9STRE|nr:ParB N-terminal domain-containing protein [Streptococcus gallolyticus]SES04030.1 ParB-like nuclease domain-containing protein [Streptococcus gallolyticus]
MTEIIEIGKIFATTDYNYFKKLIGNRNVEKYAKLKENIERDGQLVPVVVNEKQEVLDGQHRIAILKELQRPVEFVVKKGGNFSSVISMNTAQKKLGYERVRQGFC